MNDIYLIRHTSPAVAKGVCYGQSDLDITESFREEADLIRQHLPDNIQFIHSSPLRRCTLLAEYLFPSRGITLQKDLMEIHCGQWEMRSWDELPKEEIDPWMKDFVNIRIPGGESYLDLHARVIGCFNAIRAETGPTAIGAGSSSIETPPTAIVAHGGVIRTILSQITGTPLIDSFKAFSLYYGCVIRLSGEGEDLHYSILSNNPPTEKEQHKPSGYYK